jgi:hypothetical protein
MRSSDISISHPGIRLRHSRDLVILRKRQRRKRFLGFSHMAIGIGDISGLPLRVMLAESDDRKRLHQGAVNRCKPPHSHTGRRAGRKRPHMPRRARSHAAQGAHRPPQAQEASDGDADS